MLPTNKNIWEDTIGKRLLLIAMTLVLVTHGVIIYYSLPRTYDAYVHMFFADHYSRFWFEPWEYRWYTGFLTISYPPMVHQLIALIGKVFPLKVAFSIYGIFAYEVLVIGVYRFSKIFFNKSTAGVAAILAVVLSSLVETLHVYGQVPTLTGLGFLLNALPFIYKYIITRKPIYLVMSLSFLAVVICSHHVTAIFGMVFFIAPVIFMALADGLPKEQEQGNFFIFLRDIVTAALKAYRQILVFGVIMIVLALGLIFPYWYWSKTDPITQVSIPHGSRDNFLEVLSSGLVFYVIPLALIFALLPAITYLLRERRHLAWGISFFLCLLLGSGNTTPLPKLMLGEHAFNILTLDRFGFWASIIALPYMARFTYDFVVGPVKTFWTKRIGAQGYFTLSALTGFSYLLFVIFVFHFDNFRPLQPKEVEIQPIVNFLNRDDHMRWRYLTLGFGDQMAWLSANTLAATVDGNYHSARRLPELTSRPVERLENAKFLGEEGIASLVDFLTAAEKYNLKYIFSNDRFYDPLLYYTGWSRTVRLENDIMVWEKGNITTIQPLAPKELHPVFKYTWGLFPLTSLLLAILLTIYYLYRIKQGEDTCIHGAGITYPSGVTYTASLMPLCFFTLFIGYQIYTLLLVSEQKDPVTTVINYYNDLDFQRFEKAHRFFEPSAYYTLDQYLLEKSVSDGGLLPSYAKLDSIAVETIESKENSTKVQVYTRWQTALGYREKNEKLDLVAHDDLWYIVPPVFEYEIPEQQIRSHTYILFKKQGKRVISSFPTVKDDRIKKPFAAFKQVNLVHDGDRYFVTGAVLNADNVPINVALRATIHYKNGTYIHYYPRAAFQYNIAPKGSTYFQIDLDDTQSIATYGIASIDVHAQTDVSERGYIHGGTLGYQVIDQEDGVKRIKARFYNELTTDINIPGFLIAEKDDSGRVLQVKNYLHDTALRSGLHATLETELELVGNRADILTDIPLDIRVNGQLRRNETPMVDDLASRHQGIALLTHCFIANEIYLH